MFKGFTNELKKIIGEFNQNSTGYFIFSVSDLEESSDRGRGRYLEEEQKFDIRSPELQEKLGNITGIANPRAVRFVDTVFTTPKEISTAHFQLPGRLDYYGTRNYKT